VFFARPEPLELSAEALQALRLSLNTPVISTAELQVGPARAALAVHLEADGCPNVTVAIRSLRTDESVHYSFEGDLGSESSVAVALDAGLSFAETMGFLFGEDELGDGSDEERKRALERWGEVAWGGVLPSETAPPRPPAPLPPGDASATETAREFLLDELAHSLSEALGSDGPEIMLELEEEVPAELEIEPAGSPGLAPAPRGAPAPAPPGELASAAATPAERASDAAPQAPALTKFRSPPAEAPSAAPPAASARQEPEDRNETTQHALGRLKLVKRRRGRAAGGTEKPNPILRLLSSF
jgi:hypothetical protein